MEERAVQDPIRGSEEFALDSRRIGAVRNVMRNSTGGRRMSGMAQTARSAVSGLNFETLAMAASKARIACSKDKRGFRGGTFQPGTFQPKDKAGLVNFEEEQFLEVRRCELTAWGVASAMVDLLSVLEPSWATVHETQRVDVLADVVIRDPQGLRHLVRTALHRKLMTLQGDVHPTAVAVSVLGGELQPSKYGWHIQTGTNTHVLSHSMPTNDDFSAAMETCSGIGGIGEGVHAAGFFITAMNDRQETFTDFVNRQGYRYTVPGDIAENETLSKLHQIRNTPSMLTAGFPCQPWSILGDRRHSKDLRAMTLINILRAAWFLRSHSILLECVTQAKTDPFVTQTLHTWCKLTGFRAGDVHLDLNHVWASKRHRWWCLLTSCAMDLPTLHPFPAFDVHPTVGDVLPVFPTWPAVELGELILGGYEHRCFLQYGGTDRNMITVDSPLPTALHGWGNQLDPCPCKCRKHPMALQRLEQKGLFGALLDTGHTHEVLGQQLPPKEAHPSMGIESPHGNGPQS
eukprot:Skav229563  [mRNA]  locus=scaffold568:543139:549440:+ [translate_table: standard]